MPRVKQLGIVCRDPEEMKGYYEHLSLSATRGWEVAPGVWDKVR